VHDVVYTMSYGVARQKPSEYAYTDNRLKCHDVRLLLITTESQNKCRRNGRSCMETDIE